MLATIILFGGIMGVIKGVFPGAYWLSFRYIFFETSTYTVDEMPLYAQVYGITMGLMEIIASVSILSRKQSLK